MVDILHRIGVVASPEAVYTALTTLDGLAGWWTEDTTGDPAAGGEITFRFGPGDIGMKVVETRPGELVLWESVETPAEWVGTRTRFRLSREDDYTIVLFSQEGWAEPVDFMYHCSTKWATFLMSLKRYVETGKGEPAPHDVQVGNWH